MNTTKSCSLSIIGDGSVGKTSIITAFKSDGFTPIYKQTIGVDFIEKKVNVRSDIYISLRIWDIGGQSINSKNLDKYLGSSDVVFLVYDVTNADSFANLDDWLVRIREHSKSNYIYLVGNKIDVIQTRLIQAAQHEEYIILNKLAGGIFVSAKTGENLVKSFYRIAGEVCGVPLTPLELSQYDKVLIAHVAKPSGDDEERTAWADEIEAEDLAAEERKLMRSNCQCIMS